MTHFTKGNPLMTRTFMLSLAMTASLQAADLITNSIGMKLVRIEAGSFTMGQDLSLIHI